MRVNRGRVEALGRDRRCDGSVLHVLFDSAAHAGFRSQQAAIEVDRVDVDRDAERAELVFLRRVRQDLDDHDRVGQGVERDLSLAADHGRVGIERLVGLLDEDACVGTERVARLVSSRERGADLAVGLRDLVGGRSATLQRTLREARHVCLDAWPTASAAMFVVLPDERRVR
jgi:hypothetical protein